MKLTINSSIDDFTIQYNDQKITIPKDQSSLKWAKIMAPYIDSSQSKKMKLEPLLLTQFHQSSDQIVLIHKSLKIAREMKNQDLVGILEDSLEGAFEWHDFIQDTCRMYEIDCSSEFS